MKKLFFEALQTILLLALLIGIWVYGNAHYRDSQVLEKPAVTEKK